MLTQHLDLALKLMTFDDDDVQCRAVPSTPPRRASRGAGEAALRPISSGTGRDADARRAPGAAEGLRRAPGAAEGLRRAPGGSAVPPGRPQVDLYLEAFDDARVKKSLRLREKDGKPIRYVDRAFVKMVARRLQRAAKKAARKDGKKGISRRSNIRARPRRASKEALLGLPRERGASRSYLDRFR